RSHLTWVCSSAALTTALRRYEAVPEHDVLDRFEVGLARDVELGGDLLEKAPRDRTGCERDQPACGGVMDVLPAVHRAARDDERLAGSHFRGAAVNLRRDRPFEA